MPLPTYLPYLSTLPTPYIIIPNTLGEATNDQRMITPTSSQRIFSPHRSSDTHPSPCSRKPNINTTEHHHTHYYTPTIATSHQSIAIMATSASAPSFSCLDTSSSLPFSTTCKRVGSEPLCATTITPIPPISPTLRRRSSYTRRSQKAMHRAAIRRIITVSSQPQQQQQQQQKQQQQQQQHKHFQHNSACRSSSAPQLPLCASNLSRLGVVTQAVLKDHPCLTSGRSIDSINNSNGQQQQQSPPVPSFSTSAPTTTITKRTKQPIPPSITTRRLVSAASFSSSSSFCDCTATTTSTTTASSNSTTYYSISSFSSPLHTANTNTSIHSSSSLPSSFSLASSTPSSLPCLNINCINKNNSSTVTPLQLPAIGSATSFASSSYAPFNDNYLPSRPSHPSSSRLSCSTTLGRQHASYRHNKPRIQQQQHDLHSGPSSAPVTTNTPWRALHLEQEEDKAASRRHSAGESVWKKSVQPASETLFGRLRSGSTTATSSTITAPKEMVFTSQKPPPRISTTTTHPFSVATQVSPRIQPCFPKSTPLSSVDRDFDNRLYPQKSEFSTTVRDGDDGNDDSSECFYSAVNCSNNSKEWIQDVDVSSCQHQLCRSSFGVKQELNNQKAEPMDPTKWSQHTIQAPYARPRPQGKPSRRHRIGSDISVQRRPTIHLMQHQQQHSEEAHQPSLPPSQTRPDQTAHQKRQISVRYMRYLSSKPLPVLSRSTSASKNRKRSIGPATTTSTPRYRGSNLQLNKPLPPIPNAVNPCIGGFPLSSKECVGGLFAPQDDYHEARSSMVDSVEISSCRESKQELYASLLQQSGGSKEAIDATMVGDAATAMVRGGKQDLFSDGAPLADESESKGELIGADVLGKPSTMSMLKSELLLSPSSDDPLRVDKEEIYVQVDKSTRPFVVEVGSSPSETSTTKDPLLTSPNTNTNNNKNTSPASITALSLKRLETFRFPLRKSPIEKSSMARPRFHHHHHHNHSRNHSLPYNTATATYAHYLNKAAFDSLHQPLTTSDLVRPGHSPTLKFGTTLSADPATMAIASASTLSGNTQSGQTPLDTNGALFLPTVPPESKDFGCNDISQQHVSGSVSKRNRQQAGQQRLLRRSESCSKISHHTPSLSFNSSKTALLSLQARRVNKPDAKVHLLPEILTTATTTITSAPGPAVSGPLREADLRLEVGEDDGLLSGLETPVATAGLFDTSRTASTPSSMMPCETPLLTIAPKAVTKLTATASLTSAAVESPQDNTDYQLRVSEQDRIVIDNILTELTVPKDFPSETKIIIDVDAGEKSQTIVPAPGDDSQLAHGTDLLATTPVVVFESMSEETPLPLTETTLSTTLTAFKIESVPVIDAGEIKRFVKRSHALQELEATEQSYVNDLDVLVHVHWRILETKSWFPQNTHAQMRRCVLELLALHRNFLSQIQAYKVSETDQEKRAPLTVYRSLEVAFQVLSRDHRLYSQFCELRMRTVNEINRTAGQSTMTGMQKESKELMAQQGRPKSRTDLKDHLIKPIQRICRYPLLLKEILRLTSSDDPEYEFIDRAHECMRALAQQMDETQRTVERKLLTEQFLKKLPEMNYPRKTGVSNAPLHSATSLTHSHSTDNHHNQHNHLRQSSGNAIHPLSLSAHGPSEELFEGGALGEGILPGTLSKTYAGTLGSIVLAGALEYVIMPDMPIRLRYYGCFLFESMLIIVKAKKMSLYEPRQWLPLRLCELYETTRLDGYTRYGWRIMYDQYRIDFGASCEAERQAWMTALQTHIQAAKLAHARLPQDIAILETVVSSLPWNMARPSALQSSGSMGSLIAAGSESSRLIQVYHQPPSPTPSPWSTCSSAIPSPLMPPPPMATSSTSSTMMMAMSFMTHTGEPEKWNDRGTPGVSLDAYAQYYEQHIHPHSYEPASAELHDSSRDTLTRHVSVESIGDPPRGYGMAGNRTGNTPSGSTAFNSNQQEQGFSPLNRSLSQPRKRPSNESNPLSARKSESAASGHLLFPSTPFPWMVPDPRPRSHSFDVTRVFTSSHSGIKPNQRNLVQSMFKDVSTENIWTTTTSHHHHSQPSPQPAHSVNNNSSLSPMASRAGRYSAPLPFSYFSGNNSSTSPSNANGGSSSLLPPTSPNVITGMMAISGSTSGHLMSPAGGAGEEDATPILTPTLQSAGSSCSSLTSRLLRRKDSGNSAKGSPNRPAPASSEKIEWDSRKNSATTTFGATLSLNFRKNSDPNTVYNTHSAHNQEEHHHHRLSIPDPVTLVFNNSNDHTTAGGATSLTRDGGGSIYQRISVKARAQLIEKKAAHGMTASFLSAPSLTTESRNNNKSKKKGGFMSGGGRLKSSVSSQDLATSFVTTAASSSSASMVSLAVPSTSSESLATSLHGVDVETDCEFLNSLSSAAGEAARSRRGNSSSERLQRRSLGAALAMTSIDGASSSHPAPSSITSSDIITSASTEGLRPSDSTQSLPVYLASKSSSSHSLAHTAAVDSTAHKDNAVDKILMAVGRLTYKRSAGDERHCSSSPNKIYHLQYQGYAPASNQSNDRFVGEGVNVSSGRADAAGAPGPLRRFSIHASESSSLTKVPYSGEGSSPATDESKATPAIGRNHYRTASESTVHTVDSGTSIMSNRAIPDHDHHHHRGILNEMTPSSPSSVPRLMLTPSGSTRSRSSSNSSVHSNQLSIHEHQQTPHPNNLPYRSHQRSIHQQHDALQPRPPWASSEDSSHSKNDCPAGGGMAVGTTVSPRSSSSSASCSLGSESRKSISSNSVSSLSPVFHHHHHHHQDPHDRNSSSTTTTINSKAVSTSFQEGYAPASPPLTLQTGTSSRIQDRRKSLTILQNLSHQASQKLRTMIRSPSAGKRRRTVMNLSPITSTTTMNHHSDGGERGAAKGGMSLDFGGSSGSSVVLTELVEDEVVGVGTELSGGKLDVEPLMSEKDMEEIFGPEHVVNEPM